MHRKLNLQPLPKIPFTKEGYENLKKEQQDLFEKRKDAVIDLTKARAMGDLSENGYYKSARSKLSFIDSRLRKLKYLLRFGVVSKEESCEIVTIGKKVQLQVNGIKKEYKIVGSYEANPLEGSISHESPLGKLLLGKKLGDKVTIKTAQGEIVYAILLII